MLKEMIEKFQAETAELLIRKQRAEAEEAEAKAEAAKLHVEQQRIMLDVMRANAKKVMGEKWSPLS